MTAGAQPVLMVVHAHPDDESSLTGGTLAAYNAAGCRTVLITCTDGAQGDAGNGLKPGQPGHDPRLVAATRSRELDRAAAELGVHAVVKLGYPDSGVAENGSPSDIFSARPLRPMVTRLVRLIRLYRPDVLVTYPPNGLSGHPDHIRTHQLVAAAHRSIIAAVAAAEPQAIPASNVRSPLRPALYYIALSQTRLRAVQVQARAALGADAWVPPAAMAVDDAHITTTVDVTAFWPDKSRALAAHASQSDAAALLRIFSRAQVFAERVEEYIRVYPTPPRDSSAIERDLFGAAGPLRQSGSTPS